MLLALLDEPARLEPSDTREIRVETTEYTATNFL